MHESPGQREWIHGNLGRVNHLSRLHPLLNVVEAKLSFYKRHASSVLLPSCHCIVTGKLQLCENWEGDSQTCSKQESFLIIVIKIIKKYSPISRCSPWIHDARAPGMMQSIVNILHVHHQKLLAKYLSWWCYEVCLSQQHEDGNVPTTFWAGQNTRRFAANGTTMAQPSVGQISCHSVPSTDFSNHDICSFCSRK